MGDMETEPNLAEILSEVVHERGSESTEAICFGRPSRFSALARSQDAIGWQRLLEGMVLVKNRDTATTTFASVRVYITDLGYR